MVTPQDDSRPSRRSKSADAFRTISEVSDEVGVPQHVLRFWETKFSQIKPLKRGGGRRYYRPEDIDLLSRIRAWLYDDGYTIKGVQKLLREGGVPAPSSTVGKPPAGSRNEDRSEDRNARQDEDRESGRVHDAGDDRDRASASADTPQVLRPHDAEDDGDAAEDKAGSAQAAGPVAERTVSMEQTDRSIAQDADDADDDWDLSGLDGAGLDRAGLESVIESLEEIRDSLRGPPPEP